MELARAIQRTFNASAILVIRSLKSWTQTGRHTRAIFIRPARRYHFRHRCNALMLTFSKLPIFLDFLISAFRLVKIWDKNRLIKRSAVAGVEVIDRPG